MESCVRIDAAAVTILEVVTMRTLCCSTGRISNYLLLCSAFHSQRFRPNLAPKISQSS